MYLNHREKELDSKIYVYTSITHWNPSIMDTIGDQHFVHYSEVSLTQGHPVYSRRRGMRNRAVEYNVAAFSELSFAARWQGRLSRD